MIYKNLKPFDPTLDEKQKELVIVDSGKYPVRLSSVISKPLDLSNRAGELYVFKITAGEYTGATQFMNVYSQHSTLSQITISQNLLASFIEACGKPLTIDTSSLIDYEVEADILKYEGKQKNEMGDWISTGKWYNKFLRFYPVRPDEKMPWD